MTDPLTELLSGLIEVRYGLAGATISRFDDDHPIFQVITAEGCSVLRVGRGLHRYAAVLSVLERAGIPGPRAIADRSGRLVATMDGRDDEVLMIDYVDGAPTPFEPASLELLGATLGRLHQAGAAAIPAAADPPPGLPLIERAVMLPANELRFGLSRLAAARDLVTERTRPLWHRLVTECQQGLDFGAGLTTVFLHGDAHPSNSLLTPSGEVALIDWDSSGPGPAVIDLGFLAVSCDTGLINRAPVTADPARLAAVLAGYRAEFTLTADDLAAVEAAVAFRLQVAAAVGVGTLIGRGREPLEDAGVRWSLDRLRAVPELAGRIRSHLT